MTKATGMIRRIDDLGRVVIPKELRRTLGVVEGDALEIFANREGFILRKYALGCTLCGHVDRSLVSLYPGKLICTACIRIIVRDADKLEEGASHESY